MTPHDIIVALKRGKPLASGYYELVLVGDKAQKRFSQWEHANAGAIVVIASHVDRDTVWYNPVDWFAPDVPTQEYVRFYLRKPTPWITPIRGIGVPTPIQTAAPPSTAYIQDQLGESQKSWWERVQDEAKKFEGSAWAGAEDLMLGAFLLYLLINKI